VIGPQNSSATFEKVSVEISTPLVLVSEKICLGEIPHGVEDSGRIGPVETLSILE
jgi:hypothetical protein